MRLGLSMRTTATVWPPGTTPTYRPMASPQESGLPATRGTSETCGMKPPPNPHCRHRFPARSVAMLCGCITGSASASDIHPCATRILHLETSVAQGRIPVDVIRGVDEYGDIGHPMVRPAVVGRCLTLRRCQFALEARHASGQAEGSGNGIRYATIITPRQPLRLAPKQRRICRHNISITGKSSKM